MKLSELLEVMGAAMVLDITVEQGENEVSIFRGPAMYCPFYEKTTMDKGISNANVECIQTIERGVLSIGISLH